MFSWVGVWAKSCHAEKRPAEISSPWLHTGRLTKDSRVQRVNDSVVYLINVQSVSRLNVQEPEKRKKKK